MSDKYKGIVDIQYNHLNLPEIVDFGSGNEIHYVYDATGNKLVKHVYNEGNENVKDYNGNIVYDNDGTIEFIITSEGRAIRQKTENTYKYEYNLTGHLGNVRATFKRSETTGMPELVSTSDYYPFGMQMPGRSFISSNHYRFGYQGQFAEKDEETGYNQFELRLYDSRIGRWMIPDPVGQYWSPYLGMGNNPISLVDPNGGLSGVSKIVFSLGDITKQIFQIKPVYCVYSASAATKSFNFISILKSVVTFLDNLLYIPNYEMNVRDSDFGDDLVLKSNIDQAEVRSLINNLSDGRFGPNNNNYVRSDVIDQEDIRMAKKMIENIMEEDKSVLEGGISGGITIQKPDSIWIKHWTGGTPYDGKAKIKSKKIPIEDTSEYIRYGK